jgi:SAM-dependent methyltransferase
MKCRICNSENLSLFYVQGFEDQFKYYQCGNCKLVNLNLENINHTQNQQKYVFLYSPPKDYEKVKGSLDAYNFVAKYVPVKGSFMDIGCGYGSILYFFKKFGWDVKGLELSQELADCVKEKLNVDVEVSDFLKYEKDLNQFDLVSLRQVLEHLPDSVLALKKISAMLKPNGYGYFEFPNINGFSHRLQRTRNKISFLKKKYDPSFAPGHCNEFSKSTFEYLLKETGFRLIRWETYSKKPLSNFIYNHFHFGTKARAIIQKVS